MSRIRWFKLTTNDDINILESQIRSRIFSLNAPISAGFRVEDKDAKGLRGQFVHKRTIDQKISLPSGEEFVQEVAAIEITKFGIDFSASLGLLFLIDPPRSNTAFFSALSEATRFNCTIETIEVNVEEWVRNLGNDYINVNVTYLDITGINISPGIQARLAIAGDKDVDLTMRKLINFGQGGKIESAKIRYDVNGEKNSILELGCRATLKTASNFTSDTIQIFQGAMLLSRKKD
ncbi:hypothetical protein [Methylomonas methanica]|uniref:Uncharacterized protein n=1 Tax=Methylomonas methanica (strain DSM 25384 / MC09) TaxID=857087 RepID=F9ZX03_METMM|nr:hypothetical protein [Methylomonas methanica]AEF98464.1 hypothetical protein Metme_0007 [Methylomonas methanica MC09]